MSRKIIIWIFNFWILCLFITVALSFLTNSLRIFTMGLIASMVVLIFLLATYSFDIYREKKRMLRVMKQISDDYKKEEEKYFK